MNEELRKKMLEALPHLRFAVEEAGKQVGEKGEIRLGILAVNADGSGRIVSTMKAGEFFEDLAALLGAGPLTEEERMTARAEKFLTEFGLKR